MTLTTRIFTLGQHQQVSTAAASRSKFQSALPMTRRALALLHGCPCSFSSLSNPAAAQETNVLGDRLGVGGVLGQGAFVDVDGRHLFFPADF